MVIDNETDIYIEFESENEVDAFQRYVDKKEIPIIWRNGDKKIMNHFYGNKCTYKLLHINPRYKLTMCSRDNPQEGIPIVKGAAFLNEMPETNPLISWIK